MSDTFDTNLFRVTAASMASLLALTVAREMFGKSYFSLGVQERSIVDTNTSQMMWAQYANLTPDVLADQAARTMMGFQPQKKS